MNHRRIYARTALTTAVLVFAAGLRPATAGRAYSVGFHLSCGAGMDYCLAICDAMASEGFALGRCYDRCSIGAGICEASRIPVPGRRIIR